MCKHEKIVKFIDGFGQRRVFCKQCELSVPENEFNPRIKYSPY